MIEIVEQASTITERLGARFVLDEEQENDSIVNSRIEQWCQVAAQGNWEKFAQRLAWDGLDLSTVRRAVGSVRMSDEHDLPAWAQTLNECLKATATVTLETLEKGTPGKNRFWLPRASYPLKKFYCRSFMWLGKI